MSWFSGWLPSIHFFAFTTVFILKYVSKILVKQKSSITGRPISQLVGDTLQDGL
jgi:hypothetical protein